MSSAGIQMSGGPGLRSGGVRAGLLLLVLLVLPGLCRAQQPQTISFPQPSPQAYAGTSVDAGGDRDLRPAGHLYGGERPGAGERHERQHARVYRRRDGGGAG